jgi:hypothetical protein
MSAIIAIILAYVRLSLQTIAPGEVLFSIWVRCNTTASRNWGAGADGRSRPPPQSMPVLADGTLSRPLWQDVKSVARSCSLARRTHSSAISKTAIWAGLPNGRVLATL